MDTHELERWAPILGFEDRYEVSDHGRVRSLGAPVRRYWGLVNLRPRVLKPQLDGDGYLKVALGRKAQRKIHRLVAEAFLSQPADAPEIDHIDTNKANCHYSNLQWVSHTENSVRRHQKTYPTCEVKFSESDARKIAAELKSGRPVLHVAKEFGISRSHARRLAAGA